MRAETAALVGQLQPVSNGCSCPGGSVIRWRQGPAALEAPTGCRPLAVSSQELSHSQQVGCVVLSHCLGADPLLPLLVAE